MADADDLKRPAAYLGGVILVAAAMRYLAYAAAISYAAIFRLEGVDYRKIADHAQNLSGALGLIVVFSLLASGH